MALSKLRFFRTRTDASSKELPPAGGPPPEHLAAMRPYFDAGHYRGQLADAPDYDEALLAHYLLQGWREGLDPSPDFQTELYLSANPDVAQSGVNPLLHYALQGKAEGRGGLPERIILNRWGQPQSDPAHLARLAPHFDATHYREQLPALDGDDADALEHYLTLGWREGLDPSPDFSTALYLGANPDVAEGGVNPLLHYVLQGKAEGRGGLPERITLNRWGAPAADPAHLAAVLPLFDAAHYRKQSPGLEGGDADLAEHYLTLGWQDGRDPSPGFSTADYLLANPDVQRDGTNPLLHYALRGRAEGRPLRGAGQRNIWGRAESSAADRALFAPYFDAGFYRRSNPGLVGSDADLAEHYLTLGWQEGLDPNPEFSTAYYVETYPDIAQAGLNPVLHYLTRGRAEGRRTRASGPVRLTLDSAASSVRADLRSVLLRPTGPLPQPPAQVNPAALDLHWIIPDFPPSGAGGHMTIFRFIRLFEQSGHRCTIWIERASAHATAEAAYDDILRHYQCLAARVAFLEDGFFAASGDAVIATAWTTAYPAARATGFAAKFYLVQDHESEFHGSGAERSLAEASYDLDLACLCASPWLAGLMQKRGRWARPFHLAYDHETYRLSAPPRPRRPGPPRLAVYGRDHTARRAVQLALMALDLLAGQGLEFEVHFFGQDEVRFAQAPYPGWHHGVLAPAALAELYADCDIGICFSATNYSLVPQEMMATGLPVVELDGESTRATFPPGAVTLAGPAPEQIAAALARLMGDPAARESQRQAALGWVQGFTWEQEAARLLAAITERLAGAVKLAAPVVRPAHEDQLDVVIPVKDGGALLQRVIGALREQALVPGLRIWAVDSGSSDGSAEWLAAQPDVRLTRIAPQDFQHGRTRNLAIAQGSAPHVAVLTQDALPAHRYWAADILTMFRHFPDAAGLFGRHLPYPQHSRFTRDAIEAHFQAIGQLPLCLSSASDPARWAGDPGWRRMLHFFSDNNAALRRAVWQDLPYPEVDYGEDQLWAQAALQAGFSRIYAPTVTVYHSHDFDAAETRARAEVEGHYFRRHFGYQLAGADEAQMRQRLEVELLTLRRRAPAAGHSAQAIEAEAARITARYEGWLAGQNRAETGG